MIVHPTQTGWQVIYHRAHALLAAQIAGQWRRKEAPPRLYETLAAISHHDDLEREWEENNLTKAGAPMDFTQDQETSFPRLRKHLQDSLYRGRWVALLTSMHMSRLLESQRGTSKEADEFLDDQIEDQKRWCQELGISKEDASSAYDFLQWCDRCSLILCQAQLPEDERALEVSKAHDGKRYDIRQFSDGTVTIEPWCFENDRFTVNVEVSNLNQIKFENNASLTAALKEAQRQLVEWTFVKSKNNSKK
ncbi:MAG: DUF3891 family protein [Myxacorys californica WJT36-NPBG1]|jgi:hypothetical protein|nr:DUF3891 family protein [Myxacorys californica WJT36-NPBG1]